MVLFQLSTRVNCRIPRTHGSEPTDLHGLLFASRNVKWDKHGSDQPPYNIDYLGDAILIGATPFLGSRPFVLPSHMQSGMNEGANP